MKPIVNFLAILAMTFGLWAPSIQKKAASDMATISGSTIKPLQRGKDLSFNASATFHVAGYYQFYAYVEDTSGKKIWTCGSVTSQRRSAGDVVNVSGTFPASQQLTSQFLNFVLYCTSGDYSGYRQSGLAYLELIESKQYIDPADSSTISLPGTSYYWDGGYLRPAYETLAIPVLNREAIDPDVNYLEILGSAKTFTYRNAATSNSFGSASAELWLLNHFEDFGNGNYYPAAIPERRVFPLVIGQWSAGVFYFVSSRNYVYDRRNLQMLKTTTAVAGETFSSNKIFFPIGLGRTGADEEPYRWRLIMRNFGSAGHYFEFNGTFKRSK
ncbi:MAG: hypothetical protein J5736_05960, partial [Bacilli bacterium]|nr:hypothetical protein [Bacilli bacterium]